MQRLYSLFILVCCLHLSAKAQNDYNLNDINAAAKVLYVKPETLDRLMIRLRVIESATSRDQKPLLLDTYRVIADQYVANNHFSQAYQVYTKYLEVKEDFLEKNFNEAIDSTKKNIEVRRLNDGSELMNLQNQVQQLQIDNDLLISKRLNFKKYFSFLIIALSALFGFTLVQSAMKLIKIRNQLKENREIMKSIHRISTIGAFSKGLVNQKRQNTGEIEDLAMEIQNTLKSDVPSAKEELELCAEIRNSCKEIIKVLNASGIEA